MNAEEFFNHLVKTILPFLPGLFGAVEYIKSKKELSGPVVEYLSIGLFVLVGVIAILTFFFPGWGAYVLGGFVFLLVCALAPMGFYKFVNARTTKNE